MKFKNEIITKIQNYALNNRLAVAIARYLIQELHLNGDSRMIVIVFFIEAFNLRIADIKELRAWEFFDGGTLCDERIDRELNPLIVEALDNLSNQNKGCKNRFFFHG